MTDLQISLMAIGAAVVLGVISYNKWQEYRTKKSVQRAFAFEHDDVLMQPAAKTGMAAELRQEPVLEGVATADTDLGAKPASQNTAPGADTPAAPRRELPVDELIDCSILLAIEAPVRGEKVATRLQTLRHVGNKSVHFIGQLADGSWDAIAHDGIYYGIAAGVQLASRNGALNELEYSELIARLRQIADDIEAEPDVPDMAQVISRARSLHQFVLEFDAQLGINVQSRSAPWAVNTLLTALERQGFDLRPDGRLLMPDGDGGVLFSVSTNVTLAEETTSRLTLLLDVPRVAPLRDGFGAMTACARMLANRLEGTVVDDSGQPLTQEALAGIASQLNEFYRNMEAANIPAGSTRALRLFS